MTEQNKSDHIIVAVHITERTTQAALVQSILTENGGSIKTRVGLHEPTPSGASPSGVILLELVSSQSESNDIIDSLNAISGVEAKSIVFAH